MTASKRRKNSKNRREGGSFVAIPHRVLSSNNYRQLSPKAVKLLVDLTAQIRHRQGRESTNGNLCAAFKIMKPLGWKSTDTLDAAEAELLHFGFIEITQRGGNRKPTLYAVTWEAISYFEDKPHIEPTQVPSGKWQIIAEKLPPRRRPRKKLIPNFRITPYPRIGLIVQSHRHNSADKSRLNRDSRKFHGPSFWVSPCPRTGSFVQNMYVYSPRIGWKLPKNTVSVTRQLGPSIDLPYVLTNSLIHSLVDRVTHLGIGPVNNLVTDRFIAGIAA